MSTIELSPPLTQTTARTAAGHVPAVWCPGEYVIAPDAIRALSNTASTPVYVQARRGRWYHGRRHTRRFGFRRSGTILVADLAARLTAGAQ